MPGSTTLTNAAASAAASMRTQPATPATPAMPAPRSVGQRYSFILDPDLALAAEDAAISMGMKLPEYLQQVTNDAMRAYLGV